MVDAGSKEIVFSAVFSSKTVKISRQPSLPYSMSIVSIKTKTNTLMQRTRLALFYKSHHLCVLIWSPVPVS